jgi:PH domain
MGCGASKLPEETRTEMASRVKREEEARKALSGGERPAESSVAQTGAGGASAAPGTGTEEVAVDVAGGEGRAASAGDEDEAEAEGEAAEAAVEAATPHTKRRSTIGVSAARELATAMAGEGVPATVAEEEGAGSKEEDGKEGASEGAQAEGAGGAGAAGAQEGAEGAKEGKSDDADPEVVVGYVEKKGEDVIARWKRRFIVLDGGILSYFVNESDYDAKKPPNRQRAIELKKYAILSGPSPDTDGRGFYLQPIDEEATDIVKAAKGGARIFYFRSLKAADRQAWLETFHSEGCLNAEEFQRHKDAKKAKPEEK